MSDKVRIVDIIYDVLCKFNDIEVIGYKIIYIRNLSALYFPFYIRIDRKSVVEGKSVLMGGRRII